MEASRFTLIRYRVSPCSLTFAGRYTPSSKETDSLFTSGSNVPTSAFKQPDHSLSQLRCSILPQALYLVPWYNAESLQRAS